MKAEHVCMCGVRAQAQVDHMVSLYSKKSWTSSTPFSDPPFKLKKEAKLRKDLTGIARYLDHVIRQPGLREFTQLQDMARVEPGQSRHATPCSWLP